MIYFRNRYNGNLEACKVIGFVLLLFFVIIAWLSEYKQNEKMQLLLNECVQQPEALREGYRSSPRYKYICHGKVYWSEVQLNTITGE